MRLLILLMLSAAILPPFASASEEPKFFLNADGTVEQRVTKIESQTAALEKRIADLEAKLAGKPVAIAESGPITLGPGPTTVTLKPRMQRVQVCENGVCRIVEVPVSDSVLSPAAAVSGNPCPQGECADCQCAGAANFTPRRSGWYLGKFLGR